MLKSGTVCTALLMILAASNGYAATISTLPFWSGGGIQPFGETNTATYGQTLTVTGPDTVLNSFEFRINDFLNPDFVDLRFNVAAWNGSTATGPLLYQSAVRSTTNSGNGGFGYESIIFNTGGVQLTAGQQYVFFISAVFDGLPGTAAVGTVNNVIPGNFVYLNNGNNPSQVFGATWNQITTLDFAFRAEFSAPAAPAAPVPEPTTLTIFGLGTVSLAFAAIRRRRNTA